jgi:hypothetical protein
MAILPYSTDKRCRLLAINNYEEDFLLFILSYSIQSIL